MIKKSSKYLIIFASLFLGVFVLLKSNVHAQGALGEGWARFLEGELPRFSNSNAAGEDLAIDFIQNLIRIVKFLVGWVAIGFGMLYAGMFIFAGDKEEAITKRKKNFINILIAFILLMIADEVAQVFNPEKSTAEQLIQFDAANDQLRNIANYLKWFLGAIIIMIMTISGLHMITSGSKEEVITKEKRHIVWSGIGMMVILLASNVVNAIYVVNETNDEFTPGNTEGIVAEIASVIRLALVFLAPLTVAFTIYAGFLYLTALNSEEKATKAKKMILYGITGIIVIYFAYAISNTFIGADFTDVTLSTP